MSSPMKDAMHNNEENNQWKHVNWYEDYKPNNLKVETNGYIHMVEWSMQQWLLILTKHQTKLERKFSRGPLQGVISSSLINCEVRFAELYKTTSSKCIHVSETSLSIFIWKGIGMRFNLNAWMKELTNNNIVKLERF